MCANSKLSTHFWEIMKESWKKLSEKLKNGSKLSRPCCWVIDQNNILNVWTITHKTFGLQSKMNMWECKRNVQQTPPRQDSPSPITIWTLYASSLTLNFISMVIYQFVHCIVASHFESRISRYMECIENVECTLRIMH